MAEKKTSLHFNPLFNKKAQANFYLDGDKIHIFSFAGEPVAFVEKLGVFSFKGEHLGWYEDGWLRDNDGKCVALTEPPGKAGPNPPKIKQHPEPPEHKQEAPEKPAIAAMPHRPVKKALWSEVSDVEFFKGK
jgi:hypothetical protein